MRTENKNRTGGEAATERTGQGLGDALRQAAIRIGHFEFLNGYPLYYGLEKGAGWGCFQLVNGVPTKLNRLLLDGQLDISPVSSIEYAAHADELLLLPKVSITADGAVDSIRLISNKPIAEVGSVALTGQSATSVVLLKILLEQNYGAAPEYSPFDDDSDVMTSLEDHDAVLLIGDQALRAYYQETRSSDTYSYDLGVEWKQLTGLPMVFALWAVRRSFYRERPDETEEVQDRLVYSISYCAENRDEVVAAAAKVYPFSKEQLRSYFEKLRYDLTDDYRRGLAEFYRRAMEIGEAATVPELEFMGA